MRLNKRKTYALVNSETKKIIKYLDIPQYFRTKQLARIEKSRLQNLFKIEIEISRVKDKKIKPNI